MNQSAFLSDPDVVKFSDWLASIALSIKVDLDIKKSRFVPARIHTRVHGLHQVLSHYSWSGNWGATNATLAGLSTHLKGAVASGDEAAALLACKEILVWGGNRNFSAGAYPFLNTLSIKSQLCNYISTCGVAFDLKTADTARIAPPVQLMNSMLTKVHALYANDGLPIYDSRVAAAIASLVEMWRNQNGLCSKVLPQPLTFPATLPNRTISNLFPCAQKPGVMIYGAPGTATDWSGAKIRLGWVIEKVLNKNPSLFGHLTTMPERMRAFEAALFMIGYDVMCLDYPRVPCPFSGSCMHSINAQTKGDKDKTPSTGTPAKTIGTLSAPEDGAIIYTGTVENGIRFKWREGSWIKLSPEQIDDIVAEFGGCSKVPLGASHTLPRPGNSLGQWLKDNGWSSAQLASAIAAILYAEGIIKSVIGKKPIYLTFA